MYTLKARTIVIITIIIIMIVVVVVAILIVIERRSTVGGGVEGSRRSIGVLWAERNGERIIFRRSYKL